MGRNLSKFAVQFFCCNARAFIAQRQAETHIGHNNRALESEKEMMLILALPGRNERLASDEVDGQSIIMIIVYFLLVLELERSFQQEVETSLGLSK